MFAKKISSSSFLLRKPIISLLKMRFNNGGMLGGVRDDEFLPDREMAEIDYQRKMDSSIKVNKKPDSMLKHQMDVGGEIYKYDLPVENKPILFKYQLMVREEEELLTPVEKLFEILDCDLDTAYESFIVKMNQNFNNEIDMYGDITKAGDSQLKVLEFGIPIPFETINDEVMMKKIRSMMRYNPDIPGAIELVHPNKFLPSKITD
jgi:hypothetical protein